MRNNFTRQKGKKKLQLHNIKVSSKKVWRYMTSKGSKALKRKRRRTCRQGVRRIWKLYSKGRPGGKLTWCEPPRDHLDCRWQENIQRSSPQITGRAKAVTTPCLDTLWVLVHSITHHIENMWRKKDILVTDKWIMNNILSFTKGSFNNQWKFKRRKNRSELLQHPVCSAACTYINIFIYFWGVQNFCKYI